MITKIMCKNCDEWTNLPFRLVWTHKQKWCEKCGQLDESAREYNFCSQKCLKEFVNKFVGHKCKWEKDPLRGILSDGKQQWVWEKCAICDLRKRFRATKKDVKEWESYFETKELIRKSYVEMAKETK